MNPPPVTLAAVKLPTFDKARMQAIVDAWPVFDKPFPIEADKRLTDPVKVAADIAKKEAKALTDLAERNETNKASAKKEWADTASSPLLGGWIFAIAMAVGDGEIEVYDVTTCGNVTFMLQAFFRRLAEITHDEHRGIITEGVLPNVYRPVLVGHGVEATVRFISQTCIALRVPVPVWWPVGVGAFSDRVYDVETQFVGARGKLPLDDLCDHLGIPYAEPMDLAGYYREGHENPAIISHAADSVRRARSLHRLMTGREPLLSDIVELGGEPPASDDDPAPDDPMDVPGPRFDPDHDGAMDGMPIDDIDDYTTIDDAEAA